MRSMSLFVNLASSKVAMIAWICLDVFLLWFPPNLVSRDVSVLVHNMSIVLASAMGL